VNRLARFGLALMLLPALTAVPIGAAASPPADMAQAVQWLHGQQLPDGGFSNGVSEGSDPATTADAVVAMVSAGERPSDWVKNGQSVMSYLAQAAAGIEPGDTGRTAKMVMALVAAGENPEDFAGINWIDRLQTAWNGESGLYASDVYGGALAVLALHAAGAAMEPHTVDGLLGYRLPGGSYAFNGDHTPGSGDSNTTALVVQALAAAGASPDTWAPSLAYFRSTQNGDGGWTYQKPSAFGEATDANSTALVTQALLAVGEPLSDWGNPAQVLLLLQNPSGALSFNAQTPGDNLLATVQAIPAMAGVPLTKLPRPDSPSAGTLPDGPFPLVVVVLEILAILLVGAAIAYRRAE
jgi:hypothetical protein